MDDSQQKTIVYRAGTKEGPSFDSDKTIDEAWLVTNPKLYFPLGQDIPEPCKKRLEGIFLWQADVSTLSKDFTYGQKYDGVVQVQPNGSGNLKDTFKEIQACLNWEKTTVPQCNEGLSVMDLSPLVQAVMVYMKDHFPTTPEELNFHAELKAASQCYWSNDNKDPSPLKKVPADDCRLKIAVRETLETWKKEKKALQDSPNDSVDKESSDFREAMEVLKNYLGDDEKETEDENGNDRLDTMNRRAFQSLGDHRKALEYHEKQLKIAIEVGDRAREGTAYGNISYTHRSLGDFRKAIEYTEKRLKIAIEIGDLAEEGAAYENLGNAYQSLGDYQKAIEYHGKHLKIVQEISDRGGEGRAYGNLGNVYQSLCDYQKAIDYHEKHLKIAKEIGDRAGEGAAFGNLGNPFQSLGDYQKAIEYQEKHLKLAIEDRDRAGEGTAYGILSYTYRSLGDFQKAFEYTENHLKIAIEDGDRTGEGTAYGNLGHIYRSLGDVRKATEYAEKHLKIAKEVGDWAGEGGAYENLGNTYQSVGDYEKAIEYHEKHLKIAKEIGVRAEEQRAYRNLGHAYQSFGDFQKGIAYDESILRIGREIGDWAGEGRVYGNLGNAYKSMGNYQKAIDYHKKLLTIAVDIGDRAGEGGAYGDLGNCHQSLGEYQKAIEYHEKHLKIAKEIGDRAGEGRAYHNIGYGYLLLEQLENAKDNFVSSVETLNAVRSGLTAKDHWKIKFRELYEQTYAGLWKSLLRSNKVDEALAAADQGRAQTLSDNLLIQYKLPASLSAATIDTKETISRLLTELSSPTLFLAIEGLTINIWFLRRGKEIAYRQGWIDGDRRDKDPIRVLVETAVKDIRAEINVKCEDRSFGEHDDPLKPFQDAVIEPILDLLGPEDDELVIVSDGVLCFTPWAAVIKSISIRTVPSLTSYQLISSVPEDYHQKTGALLVGNPYLKELKVARPDIPYAQKEVEMIASIFNTRPLTGKQATKAEVMRRMSSVGVIHIAAHANKHTGEIALCPNPGWTSEFPEVKDYILKMSDVQAANLRARLVVLSCSFSGRGRIFKGEGVVGIARAFLAAGARSVLVALWAIDDEATMVFMKSFYQHLKEGKTASAAVYQSMKSLRESKKFNKMGYWAPFQLIGDDVKIEFEVDDDVKKCEK